MDCYGISRWGVVSGFGTSSSVQSVVILLTTYQLKPGVFSEAHIAIVCQQVLLGLEYLHREGKLHRDIKAANILLSQSGKVKLADFGVAAQLVNIRSLRNTFVGTPFWMAPEVIEQSGYDFKADVWSLGITAMELVHGEPPNAGKHPMKVLMEIPKMPAPRLEGNHYSKEFKDFVAKCLIKDPDQRPSAKESLRHKFIRGAGRTEALQELILRRQEWEAGLEKKDTLKYYAETLRSIKVPVEEDDDDWVFDTVKAAPTIHHTQKRRKLTVTKIEEDSRTDEAEEMVGEMNVRQSSTMRRSPDPPLPPSSTPSLTPSARRSTKKRISSGQQKQPLGVNMSFGNSPSTVRQFRRVSPTTIENDLASKDASSTPSSLSPSKLRVLAQSQSVDTENMPPPPLPARNHARGSSRSNSSSTHIVRRSSLISNSAASDTPSLSVPSKEASLGHLLYSSAIGISCQEILSTTADSAKRDALSRLAEAFSDLEMLDPEGLYHIVTGAVQRMHADDKMKGLLPAESRASSEEVGAHTAARRDCSRDDKRASPQKASGGGPGGMAAKLVLAQNNPHLKSHRRRQSTQAPIQPRDAHAAGEESPMGSSPRSGSAATPEAKKGAKQSREEERAMTALMPGSQPEDVRGMEHVAMLGNVLFERWCEGLRGRWGGNENGNGGVVGG